MMNKEDTIEGTDDEQGGHYRRRDMHKEGIIKGRDDVKRGRYKREGKL